MSYRARPGYDEYADRHSHRSASREKSSRYGRDSLPDRDRESSRSRSKSRERERAYFDSKYSSTMNDRERITGISPSTVSELERLKRRSSTPGRRSTSRERSGGYAPTRREVEDRLFLERLSGAHSRPRKQDDRLPVEKPYRANGRHDDSYRDYSDIRSSTSTSSPAGWRGRLARLQPVRGDGPVSDGRSEYEEKRDLHASYDRPPRRRDSVGSRGTGPEFGTCRSREPSEYAREAGRSVGRGSDRQRRIPSSSSRDSRSVGDLGSRSGYGEAGARDRSNPTPAGKGIDQLLEELRNEQKYNGLLLRDLDASSRSRSHGLPVRDDQWPMSDRSTLYDAAPRMIEAHPTSKPSKKKSGLSPEEFARLSRRNKEWKAMLEKKAEDDAADKKRAPPPTRVIPPGVQPILYTNTPPPTPQLPREHSQQADDLPSRRTPSDLHANFVTARRRSNGNGSDDLQPLPDGAPIASKTSHDVAAGPVPPPDSYLLRSVPVDPDQFMARDPPLPSFASDAPNSATLPNGALAPLPFQPSPSADSLHRQHSNGADTFGLTPNTFLNGHSSHARPDISSPADSQQAVNESFESFPSGRGQWVVRANILTGGESCRCLTIKAHPTETFEMLKKRISKSLNVDPLEMSLYVGVSKVDERFSLGDVQPSSEALQLPPLVPEPTLSVEVTFHSDDHSLPRGCTTATMPLESMDDAASDFAKHIEAFDTLHQNHADGEPDLLDTHKTGDLFPIARQRSKDFQPKDFHRISQETEQFLSNESMPATPASSIGDRASICTNNQSFEGHALLASPLGKNWVGTITPHVTSASGNLVVEWSGVSSNTQVSPYVYSAKQTIHGKLPAAVPRTETVHLEFYNKRSGAVGVEVRSSSNVVSRLEMAKNCKEMTGDITWKGFTGTVSMRPGVRSIMERLNRKLYIEKDAKTWSLLISVVLLLLWALLDLLVPEDVSDYCDSDENQDRGPMFELPSFDFSLVFEFFAFVLSFFSFISDYVMDNLVVIGVACVVVAASVLALKFPQLAKKLVLSVLTIAWAFLRIVWSWVALLIGLGAKYLSAFLLGEGQPKK
ncbi:hypothetical protein DIPPA_15008 [Diplonema papillatum]|nr:hypothetical protein DIPPA_15008 [Diplonema papillatum]